MLAQDTNRADEFHDFMGIIRMIPSIISLRELGDRLDLSLA